MGHLVGKDIYRSLAQTIDGTPVRTPDSPAFQAMLKALYTPREAELICRMPYRPSSLARIAGVCGAPQDEIRPLLDALCEKGLILDIWDGESYQYMISPIVIGIFEFTMMRTGGNLPLKQWSGLFNNYMFGDSNFFEANFGDGQQVSIMRALPYESVIAGDHVEILDYEKASAMVEANTIFSIGLCSCRHEKYHLGKDCHVPMETCTSMGGGAEFLIRNNFARRIDKAEMLDILDRSKDFALTLSTDNVRQDANFICHCCGCCCNLMQGIKHTGLTSILVSSTFIAVVDSDECNGCGKCAKACPIDAIRMEPRANTQVDHGKRKLAAVTAESCLGCGACALKCPTKALKLHKRDQRVFHPADSFERVILQSLERGTLQNLIFDNPNSRTQEFMRGLVGGFLRLSPVKRGLMSETLRSRFLSAFRKAAL
ncbi:ATP-binding protein [Oleidesulfovibrio sp.]|uniref:ATP-binding protein n=1 Tax=Oleidesulfovibrio sp. TaxID=2909707 RepID=UPI003A87226D